MHTHTHTRTHTHAHTHTHTPLYTHTHTHTHMHMSPKTPKDKRFCPFCPNKVEDEIHFLLECSTYNIPRNELMNNIENPPAPHVPIQDKFKEIMSPKNAQFVAKTVDTLFQIRNFLVNKPRRTI